LFYSLKQTRTHFLPAAEQIDTLDQPMQDQSQEVGPLPVRFQLWLVQSAPSSNILTKRSDESLIQISDKTGLKEGRKSGVPKEGEGETSSK
jgi:hypothetical protein